MEPTASSPGPYEASATEALARGDRGLAFRALIARARAGTRHGPQAGLDALQATERARDLAATAGERGEAHAVLALVHYLAGRLDEATASAEQAMAELDGHAPATALAEAHQYRGLVHARRRRRAMAEADFDRAIHIFRACGDSHGVARVYDSIGNLLSTLGEYGEAEDYLERSLAEKERVGDREGIAITLGNLGRVRLARGDLQGAEQAFGTDLEVARALEDPRGVGISLNMLGHVAERRGEAHEAIRRYEESIEAHGEARNIAFARLGMARAATHLGADEAERHLEGIEADESLAGQTLYVRARIQALRGRTAEALETLRRAREASDERQDRDTVLDCLLEEGRLHEAQGDGARAVEALQAAFGILEGFGADRRLAEVHDWIRRLDRDTLYRTLLSRFFPDALVERFFEAPAGLASARRSEVTVLFSDIRGFTTFSERREAEEVVTALNAYFGLMSPVIREHGGMVDKFIGDAIMAVFGATEPREGHARRAVDAALAMREALKEFNARRARRRLATFRTGIGLHTGEAVVGSIGSPDRMDFTAIGDTVNLASRIEGQTKLLKAPVVASAETLAAAGEGFRTRPLGEVQVKGRRRPVTLYAILGRQQRRR